jgi:hypothetical protein
MAEATEINYPEKQLSESTSIQKLKENHEIAQATYSDQNFKPLQADHKKEPFREKNIDYSGTEKIEISEERSDTLIVVTKENRNQLFEKVSENPKLILDIDNPDIGLSFAAYRGDPYLLEKLPPEHVQIFKSDFFKDNKFSLKDADSFLSKGEWSDLRTFNIKHKKVKGKIWLGKDHRGNFRISAIGKKDEFEIQKDPIGAQITNANLVDKLIENKVLALKIKSTNEIHFYKLDKELNRIIEIPRTQVNIPTYVKDYKLTAFDMNILLAGKQINDIPFYDSKIAIRFDKEKNQIEPIFENTINKSFNVKLASKSDEKKLLVLLNRNDTTEFLKQVKNNKINLSDKFIKSNILGNKNILVKDRFSIVSKLGKSEKEIEKLYTSTEIKKSPDIKPNNNQTTGVLMSALNQAVDTLKTYSRSQ